MELGHPERLRHVVVRTTLERLDLGRLLAAGRQDHDRRRRLVADPADDDQPVAIGQAEVEQDEVGPSRLPAPERLGGGARLDHLVVVKPQVPGDLGAGGLVILDEQDRRPVDRT